MIFDPLGHRRIQTTSLEGQPSPSPFAALPFSFPSLFLYPSHSFIFVRSSLSHPFSLPIFPKSSWRVEESCKLPSGTGRSPAAKLVILHFRPF